MIRVFVTGASGNVGSAIVRTIQAREGFELAGGWCREAGEDLGLLAGIKPLGIAAAASLGEGLAASRPDVVVDFSAAPILESSLKVYLDAGINAVVGTTGLTDEQLRPSIEEVKSKGLRWAVIPNYSLGTCLISDFIKKARGFYPYVTITDRHTNEMANAPSGTACALAEDASEGAFGEVASREVYPGVLGGKIRGVQVFSQRLPWPGPYSAHEITLARQDELIRITIEDYTSDIYMDGVFLTAAKIALFPAGSFLRSLSEVMIG
ncbi:MAG: 4-hydroxy-tetrahydrodipicolinate reductase [Synergistaceae bacterium]|jgi:4-hydroxy-tetrahydrodipicolinate reductase|nr:4-hydroxy-tetrahydrodipicolinate reductase [Synergistaceae bacterium]